MASHVEKSHGARLILAIPKTPRYVCLNNNCSNYNIVVEQSSKYPARGECQHCSNNDFALLSARECQTYNLGDTYKFDLKQL